MKISSNQQLLKDIKTTKTTYTSSEPEVQNILQKTIQQISQILPQIYSNLKDTRSLSSSTTSKLISKILKATSQNNKNQALNCFRALNSISFQQNQVIQQLKQEKIDSVFALALLWTADNKFQYVNVVELILNACSVDLILNGKQILKKWCKFIQNEITRRKNLNDLKSTCNYVWKDNHKLKIFEIPL